MADMKYSDQMIDDIIGWDAGTWKHALHHWSPVLQQVKERDHCLEIGAHAGGLSLLFALHGANVVCSDLPNPAHLSAPVHNRYEEGRRITYLQANAATLPFKSNSKSLVGCKSVLGSAARDGNFAVAESAVAEAHRVLKPGGYFLFAENLSGSRMHSFLRKKFVPWAKHYYYFNTGEFDRLLSPFAEASYDTRGFAALLGRSEGQRRVLAQLDSVIRPLIPRSWRYLIYGLARK